MGENGAGKTTLVKILAGIYQKDKGDIRIRENLLGKITPAIIEDLGIQFIHQDRYLVPTFTVAQSVFLGHELTVGKTFLLDSKKMQKACEEFLKNVLDVNIPANSLIRDLTVAQAQIVQIAKALMYEPAIIVFDEPTAPLSRKDVHQLFKIIKRMKSQGITIIYISHYLQEIFEICDRVTVLRNGLNAGDVIPKERTIDDIVKLMVGRELSEMFPFRKSNIQDPILLVKELSRREEYKDISFEIHRGEVLVW